MGELLKKCLELLASLNRDNKSKHILVVVVGLLAAVLLAIFLIGRDNFNVFFHQFSSDIMGSSTLAIVLFTANIILAVVIVICGLFELNMSKNTFEKYIPEPPEGMWIINIFYAVLLILLIYTSIINILQYCILYIVYIVVDLYFRYSTGRAVGAAIENPLRDIVLQHADREHLNFESQRKYNILLEWFIYFKRYPIGCIATMRFLLAISALVIVFISKYTQNNELINYAYLNLIYCIIVNEVFSFGYRLHLLSVLRNNE
jgi:hypothetical protein